MATGQTLDELAEVAKANPHEPDIWFRLGRGFAAAGDRARAVQALTHAMALASTNPPQLTEICASLATVGATTEALNGLRHTTRAAPEYIPAHELLGAILIQIGDADAAALSLRVAVSRHPDAAILHSRLAEALERSGRAQQALEHARKAVRLDANDPSAHHRLAGLLELFSEEDTEYLKVLRRIRKLDPADAKASIALGAQLAKAGDHESALEILNDVAASLPSDATLQIAMGDAMVEAQIVGSAVKAYREAIRIDPDRAAAHMKLGLALRSAGAHREAIAAMRNATTIEGDNAEYFYELGMSLRTAGELREAAAMLVKAAANAPDDEQIESGLATVLTELRHPEGGTASSPSRESGGFTGDLAIFSLAELLEFLMNQRSTGVVVVETPEGGGSIELYEGLITTATYPGSKPLGQLLVDFDLITQTDLKRSIVAPDDAARDAVVGNVLVQQRLIDRSSLHDVLSTHVRSALIELVRWRVGSASFRRNENPGDRPAVLVDTRWALLEAARAIDEGEV